MPWLSVATIVRGSSVDLVATDTENIDCLEHGIPHVNMVENDPKHAQNPNTIQATYGRWWLLNSQYGMHVFRRERACIKCLK